MEFFTGTVAVTCCCIVLAYVYLCHVQRQNKNVPPGPRGLPLVGYLPFLGKNPVLKLTKLREKYGNVVSIRFGPELVVILQDWRAVKEALIKQADVFSGRPQIILAELAFTDKDIIFGNYNQTLKDQRRLSLHILREFGFGKSHIETVIMEQMESLSEELSQRARDSEPVAIHKLFFVTIMNIIWGITAGKRFERTDHRLQKFSDVIRTVTGSTPYDTIHFMPILRHFLPQVKTEMNKFVSLSKIVRGYMEEEVEAHERAFQENNLKDFIDVYLSEIYRRRTENGRETPPYDKAHLIGTIINLFVAGEDTLDTTISFALLHMVLHPEIQQKVQAELDGVVARDSFLSYSQKALAPYTEATLLEIQRLPTIVPFAVQHKTLKDTTLFGFRIPKGSSVFPNLYAIHHDGQLWSDPEVFRPERFLDESGQRVKPDWFIPFSVGPRTCLGESLARTELHLLFTSLLHRFTFETVPGEPVPSVDPVLSGVLKTQPYCLIVKPR